MTLTAILEFAEVCLMIYNIPQARKLLTESEILLEVVYFQNNYVTLHPDIIILVSPISHFQLFDFTEDELILVPFLTAKIQTLQGQCFLESGSVFEAEAILNMALSNLGCKFPRLEVMIELKSVIQLIQLKLKLLCFGRGKPESDYEESMMSYNEQLAGCLARMFDLFRVIYYLFIHLVVW